MNFDRLPLALQHRIVNGLSFKELRPFQELAIEPIQDGKSCVVLTQVAGVKTEAAFFPILSRDGHPRSPHQPPH